MRFFLHMCNFCCTFAAAKFFIYFIMVHDLYILMITAGVVSLLFKLLKQPVVLGYIVAGILVGPYVLGDSCHQ